MPTPRMPRVKSPTVGAPANSAIKWMLVFALVVLLVFAIMYVVNLHKLVSKEPFVIAEEEALMPGLRPRIVYVYMQGCGYCTEFSPIYNAVRTQYMNNPQSRIVIEEAIEQRSERAAPFLNSLTAFPTVFAIDRNGIIVDTMIGKRSQQELIAFIEKYNE
jgi:hypothetical protein